MQTCLEFGPHVPFPAPDRWIISVLSLNPIRNGVSAPFGGVLQESGIVLACPTMMHLVQTSILLRLHRGGENETENVFGRLLASRYLPYMNHLEKEEGSQGLRVNTNLLL